jgi:hypothetical protein
MMLIPVIGVSVLVASHTRVTAGSQLMFGMGPELNGALSTPLVQQAPVRLLTSWYNTPDDLSWMSSWHATLIPKAYAAGYALQLVIWTDVPEVHLTTKYGPACGRPYPLSSGFLRDMEQLAKIWAGRGPLYVSMFAEFQTYPCVDNQWAGNENYFRALKDRYMAAKAIFHQYAPNARVALSWGGWQTRWNDPAHGGGLALFPYFVDVMSASDYQSFQAMDDTGNATDVQNMTKVLGAYGPVMLSYYRPNNNSQTTFDADMQTMLTDRYLARATAHGLFAFAFMDKTNLSALTTTFDVVKTAVTRYAAPWTTPPSRATSSTTTLRARSTPIRSAPLVRPALRRHSAHAPPRSVPPALLRPRPRRLRPRRGGTPAKIPSPASTRPAGARRPILKAFRTSGGGWMGTAPIRT